MKKRFDLFLSRVFPETAFAARLRSVASPLSWTASNKARIRGVAGGELQCGGVIAILCLSLIVFVQVSFLLCA